MKRITVTLPDDLYKQILDLKKQDEYITSSQTSLVLMLLHKGMEVRAGQYVIKKVISSKRIR